MIAEATKLEWETVPCDLCGSDQWSVEVEGLDREFGTTQSARLVRCKSCNLVYLNPRPTVATIGTVYPRAYSFYQPIAGSSKAGITRRMYRGLRSLLRRMRGTQKNQQRHYPYLADCPPARILDAGCGTGGSVYPYGAAGSLLELKTLGWATYGCDIDERAAEIGNAAGLNVRVGRVPGIDFGVERFDVIRFNHVLEHSLSPRDDLAAVVRLLAPGGRIIVSGPNIGSAGYQLFGTYWSGLDLPRHFYHFTPVTLRRYCEQAGLRVKSEHHDSFPPDLIHSLRHFLQSQSIAGAGRTCDSANAVREIFDLRLLASLDRISEVLAAHFDGLNLGDNYTLVAEATGSGAAQENRA